MKRLAYILLSLLVLAACTSTSRNPQLVAADSLLLSSPDSALTLLRSMSFSSTPDRMYHYLLLADAANKCYDTLPSDTILQEVADFYDRHGSANEQVRAHYMLGCAYRDMGEAPYALDCFHTAIDHADTTASNCNYRLLMSVYGQMADLFHRQNLPQDEIWATEQAGKFFLAYGDTIGYIRNIELKAKAYGILNDTLKVIELIKESQQLYIDYGYPYMAIRENIIPIHYCVEKNELEKAQTLMQEYERKSRLFDDQGDIAKGREAYYYIKGRYFIKKNRLDSAEYYMRKLLVRGNEIDAFRGLLTIYQQKKNTDSIVKYARMYEDAVDTLNNRKRTEVVGQMSSMYNYQRFQQIADEETRKAERARLNSFIILLYSLFLIITLYYIFVRLRKKKNQRIMQLSQDYRQSILEFNKVSDELEKIRQKDTTLLKDKQNEVESLREKVLLFQKKLQTVNSSQQLIDFKDSNIVALFKSKSTGSLKTTLPTDAEWNRLIKQFSRSVPSVYTALGRDVLLSPTELRLCILLLLGFKIGDAAILLNTSAQSITNIRYKANYKLFNESTAATLEKNLMNILGKV